ncbi:MAG: PQQ-binding-like beta-propeller repeat protein [Planctomycetes bacterium]|nr:PQQ-binding-like beta-propeller repeat protein [Planctomycetota bacterium]
MIRRSNGTFLPVHRTAAALATLAALAGHGAVRAAADADRWEPAIRRFEERDKVSPPPKEGILFFGSSTMVGWNLARWFPGLPVINRGFGGSRIPDCIRYAPRIALPYAPRTIVFYAGENDVASGTSPDRVFEDFQRFVRAVREELPRTRIIFIGIKPSIARWKLVEAMRAANAAIRGFAEKDPLIEYVDLEAPLLGPDGSPRRELFKDDGLHFNDKGYAILTALVRPLLEREGSAGRWPQFRVPGSSGISDETGLPETWSETENVAWKIPIPGRGWSSPIIWGGRIFLTTAVSEGEEEKAKKGLYLGGDRDALSGNRHRWIVLAIDWTTGAVLWEREVHAGIPATPRHVKNSYASETPATDGERVYAYFGNVGLFCYDLAGQPLWSRRWDPARTRANWGTAASPALHGGRLYIVNDNEERSFIEAIDAKSGATVWRIDRDEKSNWSTPFVWETPAGSQIVTPGTGKVRSYGAGGELLWELKGMSSITIPTPVAGSGMVFVSSGFVADPLRPIYAIRPEAKGDITPKTGESGNAAIAWCRRDAAPYNPSPLYYDGLLYVLYDRGTLACLDAKTGETVYERKKLLPKAGAFTASPLACDGKLLFLSEDGDAIIVRAGRTFEVLRTNALGEMCMATPAIANGGLLIRTLSSLYRIGGRS